jgi:hypothetical protein
MEGGLEVRLERLEVRLDSILAIRLELRLEVRLVVGFKILVKVINFNLSVQFLDFRL